MAVENIFETVTAWKDEGSYPAEHTQTLEWTAKKALNIGAEIRTGADGTIYAAEPAEDAVAVYEDLHAASRAFLAENFGERFAVHRGVRKRSVGLLAAQALDNPERDRYYFPTSVVSNHSPVSELAETYSDGITVAWNAAPSDVALAVDLLRFHASDREEAELHMKGGILAANASDVLHTGENAGRNRPIHETVVRLSAPGSLSANEHEDVSILIERIYEADIRLKTDEGAERVTRWHEAATRHGVFSEKRAEFIAAAVAYITLINPEGGYGDEDI